MARTCWGGFDAPAPEVCGFMPDGCSVDADCYTRRCQTR